MKIRNCQDTKKLTLGDLAPGDVFKFTDDVRYWMRIKSLRPSTSIFDITNISLANGDHGIAPLNTIVERVEAELVIGGCK